MAGKGVEEGENWEIGEKGEGREKGRRGRCEGREALPTLLEMGI